MKIFVALTAAALVSGPCSEALAQEQQDHTQHHPQAQSAQPPSQTTTGARQMPMGQMSMMQGQRGGPIQEGGLGGGVMGATSRLLMRMIFSLMDADGDGTISLEEFKAAHERIFKGIDANKDGKVTMEEMAAFMRGTTPSVRP